MAGHQIAMDGSEHLEQRIPADRFEVIRGPLGWRCRSCGAVVTAGAAPRADGEHGSPVPRLSEAAADHALFCGRCED